MARSMKARLKNDIPILLLEAAHIHLELRDLPVQPDKIEDLVLGMSRYAPFHGTV